MKLPDSKTDVVRGYSVLLEPMTDSGDPDRGAWWDCWITTPDGRHTNSLACLEGEGQFDDGPTISAGAIDDITAWAIRHGYDEPIPTEPRDEGAEPRSRHALPGVTKRP
jgi:hypothetical protein